MDQIRQAQKDRVVIGLAGIGLNLPRLEVDEMIIEQPDTFNLFCLAMSELKSDSPKDWMGYYQIAGIHGLPLAAWDNVGIDKATQARDEDEGYCPHSDPKFPTWHRPYIAMLEQTVYLKMHDIAERFSASVRDTYRKAADDFRFPYWDWHRPRGVGSTASGISGIKTKTYDFKAPKIFTEQQIMVKKPSDNELAPMDNHFAFFTFPKQQDGGLKAADFDVNTERLAGYSRGATNRHPDAHGNDDTLDEALKKIRDPEVRNIVNMIVDPDMGYGTFEAFGWNGETPGPSGSLEGVHGTYHGAIGGIHGHMSEVLFAAFDPIFWFHHCNIDRLFAIWQSINPDSWHKGGDLLPFRAPTTASPQYWTSETARKTETFGYIYSEAQGAPQDLREKFKSRYEWSVLNTDAGEPPASMMPLEEKVNRAQVFQPQSLKSSISKTVASVPSALLGSTASAPALASVLGDNGASQKPVAQPSLQKKQIALQRTLKKRDDNKVATTASSAMKESKVDREWYIDNVVERLALNGTFTIYFFIGGVPGDEVPIAQYCIYPTLAGYTHIFAAPVEACRNCEQQHDVRQTQSDTVPFNRILLDHKIAGNLANLSPSRVEPFLVHNLRWRVVDSAARIVDPRSVSGLQIGISSKATAVDGSGGISLDEYPQVVQQIVEQSS